MPLLQTGGWSASGCAAASFDDQRAGWRDLRLSANLAQQAVRGLRLLLLGGGARSLRSFSSWQPPSCREPEGSRDVNGGGEGEEEEKQQQEKGLLVVNERPNAQTCVPVPIGAVQRCRNEQLAGPIEVPPVQLYILCSPYLDVRPSTSSQLSACLPTLSRQPIVQTTRSSFKIPLSALSLIALTTAYLPWLLIRLSLSARRPLNPSLR